MEKIKKVIYCAIRMSICNFRCSYCYLSQRESCFEGRQIEWKYSPEYIQKAFSRKRLCGICYFNLCADGETLLVKDFPLYVKAILSEGHFVEIITNASLSLKLNELLSALNEDELSRTSFKCSLHYLELKKRNLLESFAQNVNCIWNAGASATVEIVGSDIYLPFIEEIKKYCKENFGALPHVTIARDDNDGRKLLTNMSEDEYYKVWSDFDSPFFDYKRTIFGVKRNEFCYAGMWSLYVDMNTGESTQCYISNFTQNIYENVDKPIKWKPICKCNDHHCYNGHSFLCVGLIPSLNSPSYGTTMRNRLNTKTNKNWYTDRALSFFDSKLSESNKEISPISKCYFRILNKTKRILNKVTKK